MKKTFIFITFTLLVNCSFGQFKILSNYAAEMTNGALTFNTSPEVVIGANDNQGLFQTYVYFFHSIANWNKIKAYSISLISDSALKTNITQIQNASEILENINTYSYTMKGNEEEVGYGVLAQELENILPALVDTAHGVKGVNYIGIIPFLISGFQEKSRALNELQIKAENDWLREQVEFLLDIQNGGDQTYNTKSLKNRENNTETLPILYQNNPNPFSQETRIRYYLPEAGSNAVIIIYNLQGQELVSYNLTKKGEQECVINGSELMAGMYVYALIVDNQFVDSKRMILTK